MDQVPEGHIRRAAVLVAAATLVVTCALVTYLELRPKSATMAMSNLPLVTLLPFTFCLLGNGLLKRLCARLSLSTAELRMLLGALWMGGLLVGYNWATQWVGGMAAPRYFASPENRWRELIFEYLPWWMYPPDLPRVLEAFYLGLGDGEALPWRAWGVPMFWAGSAALAMTAIALGLTAVFQRQWAEHERLVYPLAQVPMDLTEGFDRRRGWPPFVRSRMFWAGFCVSAVPLLWNIVEYWMPAFPRIGIFDPAGGHNSVTISRYLDPLSLRMLPTVLGFTFLCDLNILLSIWLFYALEQAALYGMQRVGFSVGLSGQTAGPIDVIRLFAHGGTMGLAIWAIWTARGHLRRIARQVLRPGEGEASGTVILSPRTTAVVLLGGALYLAFYLRGMGYSLTMAVVWMALFWASGLAVMKFLAVSGFGYLFPNWGTSIPEIWVGTQGISEPTLVGMQLNNWRWLPAARAAVVPPHVAKLMGARRWVGGLVVGSVLLGLVSAATYTLWLCYTNGAANFWTWTLIGAQQHTYNEIASTVINTRRSVPDPGKIAVWVLGGTATIACLSLQSRLPWWPFHPVGVIMGTGHLQHIFLWLYVVDVFLVWLFKLLILRFGGITLYRRMKPCFYGLIVGYAFAAGCSFAVDLIWFPEDGHFIHGY